MAELTREEYNLIAERRGIKKTHVYQKVNKYP